MIILLLLMYTFHVNFVYSKSYSNYTLFRCVPLDGNELDFLKNLTELYTVDFWRPPGLMRNPVEFLIPPEQRESFTSLMKKRKYYYTTLIQDVQSKNCLYSAFDSQTVRTYERRKMDSFDWKSYFRVEDIYDWLRDLAKYRPGEVTVTSIGDTYEGRQILAATVILKGSKRRSTVIVEGGIHAREWIAPAFVTYMLNEIVNAGSSNDVNLKNIALTYDWVFVPVVNPDGYEYSHTADRMWRKNRQEGYGADINRNFDIAFGTVGISRYHNEETYSGQHAFSEKESRAMKYFIGLHQANLEYYLAFHSYGQYIILPYAYTKKHLDNFQEMTKILNNAKKLIARRLGTSYTVGTAYDTVGYTTSGVSGCWAKATFRIPYVATFELRDTGASGFALPPSQILPTCLETMDGVLSILQPKTKQFVKLRGTVDKHTRDGQPNVSPNNLILNTLFLMKVLVIKNVLN